MTFHGVLQDSLKVKKSSGQFQESILMLYQQNDRPGILVDNDLVHVLNNS